MNKNEIQSILKQFNTCISFNNNNIPCKAWFCIDKYYISYRGTDNKTTLKNIIHLLNDDQTTNIKVSELN